jgi:uncharacterized protein YijF (DUF1287 family)
VKVGGCDQRQHIQSFVTFTSERKERPMSESFKKGDKVQWKSAQGTVHGTVIRKLTEPTDIKGHHVNASSDDPQYLVSSDKTGAEAAHKPDALKKLH